MPASSRPRPEVNRRLACSWSRLAAFVASTYSGYCEASTSIADLRQIEPRQQGQGGGRHKRMARINTASTKRVVGGPARLLGRVQGVRGGATQ
eukprot:scaffold69163_cov30-Tisochrysis_lutea.AAC.4